MIHYNYDCDFKIAEPLYADAPFRYTYYAKSEKTVVAEYDGTDYHGCYPMGDMLIVPINAGSLGLGEVKVRREYYLTDKDFTDGICNRVTGNVPLGIEIWRGETDGMETHEVKVVPAYQKGDPFTFDDMTDAQKQDIANRVPTKEPEREQAEVKREQNELLRQAKEAERETKEAERQSIFSTNEAERQRIFETNEAIREENETKRVDAEILRQEAETIREAAVEAAINELTNAIPEVVNDLTTGGADKALSAEMGKEVNKKLSETDSNIYKINDNLILDISGQLVICDEQGNVIFKSDENGVNTTNYSTPYCKTEDNGINELVICDEQGNVIFKSDEDGVNFVNRDSSIVTAYANHIKERYNKAAISWIDDDFLVYGSDNSTLLPIYAKVHDFCIEKDIRYDFACIPFLESNEAKLALAKEWESEGFTFVMHPKHDGWYTAHGNVHDIVQVRKSLVDCLRFFDKNFISKRNILVYPGSSHSYDDNVDFIRRYVECAITASEVGSNSSTEHDRYQLRRMSIYITEARPKSRIKENIRRAVENGDWIILYTHLYNHDDSEVVDDTTNSLANLKEIVEYANSLCRIRPSEEVWRERKTMYNLN